MRRPEIELINLKIATTTGLRRQWWRWRLNKIVKRRLEEQIRNTGTGLEK